MERIFCRPEFVQHEAKQFWDIPNRGHLGWIGVEDGGGWAVRHARGKLCRPQPLPGSHVEASFTFLHLSTRLPGHPSL